MGDDPDAGTSPEAVPSPFEKRPGAVVDAEGVIAHYGDPFGEQRRLASGAAIADLAVRRVIEVAGEDRLTWLNSITSQELVSLPPGVGTELLVLDPQGHVEHQAAVVDDGASTWLIVEAVDAPGLSRWLTMMRFRARVAVIAHPELHVMGAMAAGAGAYALRAFAVVPNGTALVWHDPWSRVSPGGHQYATAATHPGAVRDWVEVIVDDDARAALARDADHVAGMLAVEALRVAAWRPRLGAENDERTIPHELDWLRTAVHLDKGCYRGQETVAKVHNLGHPPRRLVMLQLDGELPEPGAEVTTSEGTVVGAITSAVRHADEGPIALAVVRRSVAVDVDLVVAGPDGPIAAAQEVIVPPDAGAAAGVPRLPRLSSRR